ncbi:MAG TPA: amidohydrolase family protein [Nitrososphaerales archaeon]|nr:amidohydrolase family protein [Nitrososphaerales archaeon]
MSRPKLVEERIDFHVHPWTRDFMEKNECIKFAINFFKIPRERLPATVDDLVSDMDQAGVKKCVILGQDMRSVRKREFKNYTLPNEELKKLVDKNPDRFIAFGAVDARKDDAKRKLRIMARDYGFKGIKFHCDASALYPNDKILYPIYEKCEEYGLVTLHHTGTTGLGYCKIKFGRPLDLDDVAQDFPDLKIVCAHFGWPWMEECFAVATRNPNVYVDISGWLARYFPPLLITYMNGLLKEKMLFGTDYPMIRTPLWMKEFEEFCLPKLKEGVAKKVLGENARKLLRL